MNIRQLLNGTSFPYESAIYAIFDKQDMKLHVISRDVNSRYGVVQNQLEISDGMTPEELDFLNALTNQSQWRGGEDYAEFFDGVPPGDIIHHITGLPLLPLHFVVPYDRHDVRNRFRGNILPELKDTEEKHGPLTFHNSDELNVCMPQSCPPRFLIAKISVSGYIAEVQLASQSVLYEKEVSRYLSPQWRETLRANALEIIKDAALASYGLDQAICALLTSSSVETWPRVMHPHLTVD
jgi:hypothetical protein